MRSVSRLKHISLTIKIRYCFQSGGQIGFAVVNDLQMAVLTKSDLVQEPQLYNADGEVVGSLSVTLRHKNLEKGTPKSPVKPPLPQASASFKKPQPKRPMEPRLVGLLPKPHQRQR